MRAREFFVAVQTDLVIYFFFPSLFFSFFLSLLRNLFDRTDLSRRRKEREREF